MTNATLTVVPAYGRDYGSAKEAATDWDSGKDFRISDISSRWDGKVVSKRDLGPEVIVTVRYSKLRRITTVRGGNVQSETRIVREG